MNVAFLPIIPWNERIFQRPHHLSVLIASQGHSVFYVDAHRSSPRCSRTELRDGVTGVRIRHSQYQRFKKDQFRTRMLAKDIEALEPEALIINAPYWSDVAIRIKQDTGCKIIYDILDYVFGFEDLAPNTRRLHRAHALLLEYTDHVTFTAMGLRPEGHLSTSFMPNGVEIEHWDKPREPGGRPGFYGALGHWVSIEILEALRPDIEIIGPSKRLRTKAVDYAKLPAIASKWGCGLIPFGNSPLALHVNPVKFYEYMALGLPVISTPLPELVRMSVDMAPDIRPVFIEPDGNWRAAIQRTVEADTPYKIKARKEWAGHHTWTKQFQPIVPLL